MLRGEALDPARTSAEPDRGLTTGTGEARPRSRGPPLPHPASTANAVTPSTPIANTPTTRRSPRTTVSSPSTRETVPAIRVRKGPTTGGRVDLLAEEPLAVYPVVVEDGRAVIEIPDGPLEVNG